MLFAGLGKTFIVAPHVLPMKRADIAIIGGSGVYESELLENAEMIEMDTPYGKPSAPIEVGTFMGKRVAFLSRHGPGHRNTAHVVNYRANVWALKELGVERIIAVGAVGSLKEGYRPGDLCFPDQFIDFTKNRVYTFRDSGTDGHISMADPFCPYLRGLLSESAAKLGIPAHETGTYICIEGPRFSTRAESRMFRQFADIIGMTLVPEVTLARELGMCYASVAMITDYDVWADKPVSLEEVLETMNRNVGKVRRLISEVIPLISEERDGCPCRGA